MWENEVGGVKDNFVCKCFKVDHPQPGVGISGSLEHCDIVFDHCDKVSVVCYFQAQLKICEMIMKYPVKFGNQYTNMEFAFGISRYP